MSYFECPSCKTRLYSAARPRDLISDLCPVCGECVDAAAELTVGQAGDDRARLLVEYVDR